LDTIITGGEKNGLGLLCISTDAGGNSSSGGGGEDDGMVLACPSVQRGQVRVELYGLRKNILIDAHESPLAAMALSVDGSLLATASERGTLIRLFETGKRAESTTLNTSRDSSSHPPGTPLREFRRGVEHAKIGSLSFSLDKTWLACASDRETVHIFKVYDEEEQYANDQGTSRQPKTPTRPKPKSSLSNASTYAKRMLPSVFTKSPKKYLQGEQSFVQVRGGITHPQICAFVPDQPHTIAVAGLDDYGNGCLMLASFGHVQQHNGGASMVVSTKAIKGEAKRIAFHRFFKKGMGKKGRSKDEISGVYGGDDQVVCSDENGAGISVDDVNTGVEQISFGDCADSFVSIGTETDDKNAVTQDNGETQSDAFANKSGETKDTAGIAEIEGSKEGGDTASTGQHMEEEPQETSKP